MLIVSHRKEQIVTKRAFSQDFIYSLPNWETEKGTLFMMNFALISTNRAWRELPPTTERGSLYTVKTPGGFHYSYPDREREEMRSKAGSSFEIGVWHGFPVLLSNFCGGKRKTAVLH